MVTDGADRDNKRLYPEVQSSSIAGTSGHSLARKCGIEGLRITSRARVTNNAAAAVNNDGGGRRFNNVYAGRVIQQ
jgi:hypothetical protein